MNSPIKTIIVPLAMVATMLAGSVSARAENLYGLTFFDNQLISVDTTTGAGTLIGSLGATVSGYGLSFKGSTLYTFDSNTDQLRSINLSSGAVGSGINIGVGNLTGEGDLAFRADGVGFLSSALAPDFSPTNELFMFDSTLGTSALIGNTAVPLDGMVFVGNTLYAIGQEAEATLYTVNQSTAALTAVGSLGIAKNSPFGALTLGADGKLYAAIDDRLFSINQMTGAASWVDANVLDTGYASVSGLAASGFQPVPEPSTYGLAGTVLLIGAGLVRRLRRKPPTAVEVTS